MKQREPGHPIADEDLAALIREALQEPAAPAEPSAQVWFRIRAEVGADRVPMWVAWWRRLRLLFADRLPRTMQQAIVLSLALLLASMSFGRMGWLGSPMSVSEPANPSNQRQIVLAEQRFREQFQVALQFVIPKDIPPKGERRALPHPAPFVGPQHLAVGALNPS
jgi:hypothetical protein